MTEEIKQRCEKCRQRVYPQLDTFEALGPSTTWATRNGRVECRQGGLHRAVSTRTSGAAS